MASLAVFALSGCAAGGTALPNRGQMTLPVHRATGSGTETLLYTFQNNGYDGVSPLTTPYIDSSGALYGEDVSGGTGRLGAIYKLTPKSGKYTETILHSFMGYSGDGEDPEGQITGDKSGALYGTTYGGVDYGTVFKLIPKGSSYNEDILYSFKSFPDGANPTGGVITDKKGDLFGTTTAGGTFAGDCGASGGCGIVFELVRQGATYKESVLYTFVGQGKGDGSGPIADLIMDSKGALYGTTEFGGSAGYGTIFRLKKSAGVYKETVLHTFAGPSGSDGYNPEGRLILDKHGILYGTANSGGTASCGCGMAFEIHTNGKGYRDIDDLQGYGGGSAMRASALAFGANGVLYGTTYQGGTADVGLIFSLTPSKSGYTYNVLHDFGASGDGSGPYAGLVADGSGHYFGTTVGGGSGGSPGGTVFEFTL